MRWTASASVGYGKNKPLSADSGFAPYHSWLADAGLNCRLTDKLALGLQYGRDQLTYEFPASSQLSNRNRAWFWISYSFSRPLGR
jgi:hypothetical protein